MEIPEGWKKWPGHGDIPFEEVTNHYRLYGDGYVWGPHVSEDFNHDRVLWQWDEFSQDDYDIIAYKVVG